MDFVQRLKNPHFAMSMGMSLLRVLGCVSLIAQNIVLAGVLLGVAEFVRLDKEAR